jgi:hypothetical protein
VLQQSVAWTCRLESLDQKVLSALAGVGAPPRAITVTNAGELRHEIRTLVQSGQSGVFELNVERGWARSLIAQGRLLGAYSDSSPEVTPSLADLGALLGRGSPRVQWFSAEVAEPLSLPAESLEDGAGPSAVERQVIWIVSSFEGNWGRARERGGAIGELQEALVQMGWRTNRSMPAITKRPSRAP